MIFVKHSNWEGKHSILSPSKWQWLNDDEESLKRRIISSYMPTVGKIIHDYACDRITYGQKLQKTDKKDIIFELLRNEVPRFVVSGLDMNTIFENLYNYINDCIGFRMSPEVGLGISDYGFGHTDCIGFNEKENLLRVFDLKTGKIPAHMEQLIVYCAYFCIEYHKKPYEFNSELRIYQNNEIIFHNPQPEEVAPVIDNIVSKNNYITRLFKEG